jgi:sodium-dependent phosphate cotransporter
VRNARADSVARGHSRPEWQATALRAAALFGLLYGFLVSIGLLGRAFRMFSGGFVGELIENASNPLIGLFVGILVTTLVQSSSTTTSLVVAMVGSGTMPIDTAIPVVMDKCVMCHENYKQAKESEPIGMLSYTLKIE